jgi:hypothetical protein
MGTILLEEKFPNDPGNVALFLELLRKFPSRELSPVNQGNVPLVIGP